MQVCTTTVIKRAPRDTFFRNHEPSNAHETILAICKTCQFIFHHGNINFQIVPFYSIATQSFWCTAMIRALQKDISCIIETRTKFC